MARKRKATKAEIIKRILDEDAQREEETGYGFAQRGRSTLSLVRLLS